MNIFLKNTSYRQLLINQWISGFGDTIFYLAFINYVSKYPFAPLAILLISISETLPQISQVFTGVMADFQKNRVSKCARILLSKVVLYGLVTVLLLGGNFSLLIVLLICSINFVSDSISYFSGAMLTPIYVKLIDEDMRSAMGFRQATMSVVNIIGNLAGGALLGLMSIGAISGLNSLTFLLAYVGFQLIRKNLMPLEPSFDSQKTMSLKNFWLHLLDSIKLLSSLKGVLRLLAISALGQVVLNILMPATTLLLLHTPFMGLQTGQSLAVLSTTTFTGLVLGALFSGNLFKTVATQAVIYLSLLCETLIVLGFFSSNFICILLASFVCAISIGVLGPRLQEAVFILIPEELMGAITASIGAFSLVVPSIVSMLLIALASGLGTAYMAAPLLIFMLLAFYLTLTMGGREVG